jgi:hypothetical protein
MDGDDDADREAILARRHKLVATALVGLSLGCGADHAETRPDALDAPAHDSGGETRSAEASPPQPCLDLRVDPGDDGTPSPPPPPSRFD